MTRRIAGRAVADQPVAQLMTRPVATVAIDQPLYEAIGVMRRHGLRHMPVVDAAGALAGMLYLHDALAAANAGLVEQIERLTHESTLDGLREVKAAEVELAADLVADRVPAPEIQSLISAINNDIYRRVLALNLEAMRGRRLGRAAGRVRGDRHGLGRARRELSVPRPGQRLHPRRLPRRGARSDRRLLHRARRPHDRPARPARVPALPRRGDGDQPGLAQVGLAVAPADRPLGAAAQRGRDAARRRAVRLSERVRRAPPGR